MKLNETLAELEDLLGEQHIGTSYDTPLRDDAFDLSDIEKMSIIAHHFREIGWIDLAGLKPFAAQSNREAVLNGIAWDGAHDRLFVTGKLWPNLFEIKLVPARTKTQIPWITSTTNIQR